MQLNFNYDKVIIVKYLLGGGGKFLCACLGLSGDAVLMREDLTKMQLDGKLPIEKKLKYLLLSTKQQSERQIWNDFGLMDFFWGVQPVEYLLNSKERIIKNIEKIVYECIDNNKFMTMTVHEDAFVSSMLDYWKNSKVILFKNEEKFRSTRNKFPFVQYKSIDYNWKSNSDSMLRSYYSHQERRDEVLTITAYTDDPVLFDPTKYNNQLYEWDSDWYYSRDRTVSEIEKLYDSFGLSGFNSEVISEFYDAWIGVILK